MTNEEFNAKFADMLERFDNEFETEANYNRIADEVNKEAGNDDNQGLKQMAFEHFYNTERTNSLMRFCLKEFLLPSPKD